MNRQALDELKQQIPLMRYLQAHDWYPARRLSQGRWMGLCPLHADHKPSFLVDPHKDLFYCYGCGRGGDVIRFAELYHHVRFSEALALLRQWRGAGPLLDEAARFCRRYDPPGGAAGDHHRLVPNLSADPSIERSFLSRCNRRVAICLGCHNDRRVAWKSHRHRCQSKHAPHGSIPAVGSLT